MELLITESEASTEVSIFRLVILLEVTVLSGLVADDSDLPALFE